MISCAFGRREQAGCRRMVINEGKIGPTTQKLYDAIVGIQYGKLPDTRSWTVEV